MGNPIKMDGGTPSVRTALEFCLKLYPFLEIPQQGGLMERSPDLALSASH